MFCKRITIRVTGSFEYSGYCHCARCRAVTGSAFSVFAAARTEQLTVEKGADALRVFARNEDNRSHFCKFCSTTLFAIVRNGEYAHVQMGVLTGDPGIYPQCHLFIAQKAPWYEIADDLPRFAGLPTT